MEEVILRFPHLSVQIFQRLDVKSLANCKEVSGSWANLIEHEKPLNDIFVIMRLIHHYWKDLPPGLLDWDKNNIQFIMNKYKQKGMCYVKHFIHYHYYTVFDNAANLWTRTRAKIGNATAYQSCPKCAPHFTSYSHI